MAIAGTLQANATATTRDFEAGLRRMRNELAQTRTSADNAAEGFVTLSRSVTGLAGGALSLAGIKAGIESIVRTGLDLERLRNSFTAITGSANVGRQEFEFVTTTANRLGLGLQELGESYRGLAASTRGTTLAGQETRELFVALTNASRVYGLSTEQTGRALTALQQIISKGKVSQEELRQQLSEAIPGAAQIAARAFGVTTQQLNAMIEKGVDSIDFVRKFSAQLQKETPIATEIAGKGIALFGNEILLLKDRIAQSGVLSFLDRLAERGGKLLQQERQAIDEQSAAVRRESTRALRGENPRTAPENLRNQLDTLSEQIIQAEDRLRAAQQRLSAAQQQASGRGRFSGGVSEQARDVNLLQAELDALRKQQTELAATIELRKQENRLTRERAELLTEIGPQFERGQQASAELAVKREAQIREDLRQFFLEEEAQDERRGKADREALKNARELEQEDAKRRRETTQLAEAQERYIQGLRDELTLLEEGEESLERQRLLTETIAGAGRETAEGLLEQVQARREFNKLLAEGEERLQGNRDEMGKSLAKIRTDAAKEATRAEIDELKRTEREIERYGDIFADTILSATDIGKRGFRDFADSVISDLQRIVTQQVVRPAISSLIQTGLNLVLGAYNSRQGAFTAPGVQGSGTFDTGGFAFGERQQGGPVMGPGFYQVGEAGPEILALRQGQSGYVYPNGTNPMPSVYAPVTVYAQDATSFQRSSGQVGRAIVQQVQFQIGRNG
jgi:tape measure domain-containing protein